MDIIITGDVGVGKSTVCRKIVEMAKADGMTCGGVLTSKQDENLLVENIVTGETHLLASANRDEGQIAIGRYFFNRNGIEFGQLATRQSRPVHLLTVDEMGPLELKGEGFSDVFNMVHERRTKNNLLVIRKNLLHKCEKRLNLKFAIFEITLKNRKTCHETIYAFFRTSEPEQSA